MENLERQVAGQCLTALNPDQKARLKELTFQAVGPRALLDDGVTREFGVGSRQAETIKGLYEAYDKKLDEIDEKIADALGGENIPKEASKLAEYQKRRDLVLKNFEAERKAVRKQLPEIDRRAIEVLNGDQITKWKNSLGKPFPFVQLQ
jgi:hypothetical protein